MPKSLMEVYQDIFDRFNKIDYDGLLKAMDKNVVVKKVMSSDSLQGIVPVTEYLKNHMSKRNCKFKNVTKSTYPVPPDDQKALYGNISGQGDYYDDDYGQVPIRVTFSWCFTRVTPNDDWMLVNVFGAPTSGDVDKE